MKKLKPHTVDWAQIERFLASADKKLASARKILAFDEEACLQQAYEAMLKASLGFMFSHGFRARSQPGHHIAIIDFVRSRIDKKHAGLLVVFDRLRRKRNLALYDDTGFISQHDAEQALESARDYFENDPRRYCSPKALSRNACPSLEREPQPEFQLPGGTEGVDACSHPDAVHVVACASSAVNLSRGSRQQSVERVPRQIKVSEVEDVVKPGAGLHRESLTNLVRP